MLLPYKGSTYDVQPATEEMHSGTANIVGKEELRWYEARLGDIIVTQHFISHWFNGIKLTYFTIM